MWTIRFEPNGAAKDAVSDCLLTSWGASGLKPMTYLAG